METRSSLKRPASPGLKKKNFTASDKKFIQTVDKWVGEAMNREKNGNAVFKSSHAIKTSKNCQKITDKVTGRPKIKLDDFEKSLLSRIMLGYYKRNPPEIPTLQKVFTEIQNIETFPKIGKTTLYKTLKLLGFVYKKRKMNIYQRLDIVVSRHKYLIHIERLQRFSCVLPR